MKKISIVLPVYNGEKYLEQALDSIIGQTYQEWELIVVNDCSNDGTSEILESYKNKDTRICIIENETNQKLPSSLNIGFEQASGEYLTWTSDDNLYMSSALEIMSQYLDENQDIDFVYTNFMGIDENGDDIGIYHQLEPQQMLFKNCVGASFLYRRKIFDVLGGYDPQWFLVEDYEYWMRVYQHFQMKHLDEVVYKYRFHSDSLTTTRLENIIRQTYAMRLYYLPFAVEKSSSRKIKYMYFDSLVEYFDNEDVAARCMELDHKYKYHYKWFMRKKKVLSTCYKWKACTYDKLFKKRNTD